MITKKAQENGRKTLQRRLKDNEYRKKFSERCSKNAKERWKDPAYREKQRKAKTKWWESRTKEQREKTRKKMKDNYVPHLSGREKGCKSWSKGLTKKTDKRLLKTSKAMKGRKFSPETILKISKSQSGNKAHAWRGGISFEPYGLEFNRQLKEQIRTRDNHECHECHHTQEQIGYKLDVHHIDFNKRNNNPENLISLCKSCHGQTNFHRKQWIAYFKKRVRGLA